MVYAKTRNEKEWKKHITALICVFIASIIMSINIKSFVKTYFPGTVVMFAEQDYNEYKIRLNNGVEIEFDINGAWKEVKSFQNFPTELLPKMIVNSIIRTYPNVNIIKVERIWNGYEIKLSNMMELFIDKSGNIVASQFDD